MRIGRFAVCQILIGLLWVPAAAADRIVLSREDIAGNNHQKHATEWQASLVEQDGTGQKTRRSSSYVEVASGLNYLDDQGVWHRSDPSFVPDGQGGFAALTTVHKLRLASNLNADHAVEFTTEDGITLRSAPLALTYFDPESGERLTVAELRDTIPVLTQTNEVVYADAFSGIFASVRYRNQLDGIHQDIVLHEAPPPPEKLGLSTRSRLEIFTEFADEGTVPEREVRVLSAISDPAQRAVLVEPDFTDETLRFGTNTIFAAGRAFYTGGDAEPGEAIPVGKRLLHQDGRRLLIEAVEHEKLAPLLKELPQAALSPEPGLKKWEKGTPAMLVRRQTKGQTRQLVAVRAYPGSGFVIDYEVKTGSANSFTFQSGVTYYVSSGFGVGSGSVSFSGGTTIKFANNAYLYYYGTPYFYGSSANPTVFTSKDDNRFGEVIAGSTGNPTQMASPALWQYYLGPGSYAVQGIRVHWAKTGLRFDWNSGVTAAFSVTDSSFARCQTAIVSSPNGSPISAYLNNLKKCAVTTAFSGGYEGNGFVEDCAGDTDSDGLADTLEIQYFSNLAQTGSGDFDGDGLTNQQELDSGGNPAAPDLGEPIGPSSRRTGMVISEVMYHPAGTGSEFVELYNSDHQPVDLTGWTLEVDGVPTSVQPSGILAPRSYTTVTFSGDVTLPNNSATLRLRNPLGAVMLEARYSDSFPFPKAADGAGHSLVLRNPSYGEGDARAWGLSDRIGGSPGVDDVVQADKLRNVVINEFLANPNGGSDYIELYNHSNEDLDIGGLWLSDDSDSLTSANARQVFPGTILAARSFYSMYLLGTGFSLSSNGDKIFLTKPAAAGFPGRVLDAVDFGPQALGISFGRVPDGGPLWGELASNTRDLSNSSPYAVGRTVVINEIMFNPIDRRPDGGPEPDEDQFVELYNRGSSTVVLTEWSFVNGISFQFPLNASIAPGGYVVVAKNPARLLANHASHNVLVLNQNLFGPFVGNKTLSHAGERIALADSAGVVRDEVTYRDGGRWGRWADGGGSSLELIDPDADNRLSDNWADSDETGHTIWTQVAVTQSLDHGQRGAAVLESDLNPDWLGIVALGEGEFLVDDLQLIGPAPALSDLVRNGTLEGGGSHWTGEQGNHELTERFNEGHGGSWSMRIRADGAGDTLVNEVRALLNEPPTAPLLARGNTVTIKGWVKWRAGHPEAVIRVHGNWAEAFCRMNVPMDLGTPGRQNSRHAGNTGPAITEVRHYPVLPQAGQRIIVSARVSDPDGLHATEGLRLFYRDGTAALPDTVADPAPDSIYQTPLIMRDNGDFSGSGDAVAGDGIYSAAIPGQSVGAVMAFVVKAKDAAGAETRFPLRKKRYAAKTGSSPDKADRLQGECLVYVGDSEPVASPSAETFGTYRIWIAGDSKRRWEVRSKVHDGDLDVTFVYGRSRVVYGAGARYSSSVRTSHIFDGPRGVLCHYAITLPSDERMLGSSSVILKVAADKTSQRQQLAVWMAERLGIPTFRRRFVHVSCNGLMQGQRSFPATKDWGKIYEDTQRPGDDFVESWFPGDDSGELHKASFWNEFGPGGNYVYFTDESIINGPSGLATHAHGATLEAFPYDAPDAQPYRTAPYRWTWNKRSGATGGNDYGQLFNLAAALKATGAGYQAGVAAQVNVDEWMRVFAFQRCINNPDSYGFRWGQNMYAYRPVTDARWSLLIWDLDGCLGVGPSAQSSAIALPGVTGFQGPHDPLLWPKPRPNIAARNQSETFLGNSTFQGYSWRAARAMALKAYEETPLNARIEANRAALAANQVATGDIEVPPGTDPNQVENYLKGWLGNARAKINGLFIPPGFTAGVDQIFTCQTPSPVPANATTASLRGTGPLELVTVKVTGPAGVFTLTPSWRSALDWQLASVPLAAGVNALQVEGLNAAQVRIGTVVNVTVTRN